MKQAGLFIGIFITLAVLVGAGVAEFFAGWLTEYSRSIDDLSIFVIAWPS